jgi:hypothetical protein
MKTLLFLLSLLALTPGPARAQGSAKPNAEPAKLEPVVPGVLRLEVKQNRNDPNPFKIRTYHVNVKNIGSFTEDIAITSYQISGETVTATRTQNLRNFGTNHSTGFSVAMNVAPENGWVLVVRRKTGELLGVAGSARRFEILARTPGALKEPPAPAQ